MKYNGTLMAVLANAAALTATTAQAAPAKDYSADEAAIRKVLVDGCTAFVAKDLEGSMAPYDKKLFTFDIAPPQHSDYEHLKESNRQLIAAIAEAPTCTYRDMVIKVYGDNAYARYILPYSAKLKSGQSIDLEGRGTDILEKHDGKWTIMHEHFSVPVDPFTGKAELKPPVAK